MAPKLRIGLAAFLITLALDLGTKMLVEANIHFGSQVEVIEGLSVGDRVVVEGIMKIRDGGPVEVVAIRGQKP